MQPHDFAHRWDSAAPAVPRRRLRVATSSPSRLLRQGQSRRCRECGNRVDWYPRADHRPIGLHPYELPTCPVPIACHWHLSGGIAYRGADSAWCRIPHAAVCPRRAPDSNLTPTLTELRRRLAVLTRRRIDAGLFTPPPPVTCPTTAQPDERPVLPIVEILRIRYLAEQPLEELRCVSQTRRGHRCPHPVLDPAAPGGVWSSAAISSGTGQLALPTDHLVLYDLNGVPYAEQLRWRTQRCPAHMAANTAPDLALAGWQVFDPLTHHTHIRTSLPDSPPSLRGPEADSTGPLPSPTRRRTTCRGRGRNR
ncbi:MULTISPECIES: DUF6083 domain-containing protein [Streptomyces]|uniref:DUF6083 domain-containing protein n=1 Tax=Streptomyces TaxID=1883 RepID=UPI001D151119|nr:MULTISPECIES: DUF6083 domain-containing protein [Streptomyces]